MDKTSFAIPNLLNSMQFPEDENMDENILDMGLLIEEKAVEEAALTGETEVIQESISEDKSAGKVREAEDKSQNTEKSDKENSDREN